MPKPWRWMLPTFRFWLIRHGVPIRLRPGYYETNGTTRLQKITTDEHRRRAAL